MVKEQKQKVSLLDEFGNPSKIKSLNLEQLENFASDLREETISAVSKTGGHLGAGLGVVELTIAIHYVFNTPEDRLVWDVGHQTYPHKILTGRRDQMHTLRQGGGLSGFTRRGESPYDCFGAGHSSTSISAALGMAVARDMSGESHEVIAVIGDGAMSAGMAYEALNNAGSIDSRLIVILNDNDMSIAPPVGAMSSYLSRITGSKPYLALRRKAKEFASYLPEQLEKAAKRAEKYARNIATGSNIFEDLGFYYIGPIDGHNIDQLVHILQNVKNNKTLKQVLIHVITEKGKGFNSSEKSSEKFHAVAKFDLETGIQVKNLASNPSYTRIFGDTLVKLAENDKKIIGITAAMPSGTGIDIFGATFPDRAIDVGIAEQHAVTFAAGLAVEGYKPFCAIYSTFLQRAYDQVVHDVAVQKLPVRFAIDRAGIVGADGPTHAGSFDITYLATLPDFVVMAASDGDILSRIIATSLSIDDRPSAFRYPRGEAYNFTGYDLNPLPIGKSRIIQEGKDIAIISFGARLAELKKIDMDITIIDAIFAKPLDEEMLLQIAGNHKIVLTIEEGAIGGFGSHVANFYASKGLFDHGLVFRSLFLPDEFMEHDTPENIYQKAGLDSESILQDLKILKQTKL